MEPHLSGLPVGSDVDFIIIVDRPDEAFERRAARWGATELPIPTNMLVYSARQL